MKMENNRMTAGTGEDSYACNSLIQAISISKIFPIVRDALEGLYSTMLPKCVMVAELGCASGPNTLLLLPEIVDVTYKTYRLMNYEENIPEIHVFLNDLPANDFNTISLSLPGFYEKLQSERKDDIGSCFISATPGSYYKRLFPSNSLHFVHCSNSAHWLSQVPKKLLGKNGKSINKGNTYIADSSPPEIFEAYRDQFEEDFSSFLKLRAQEIMPGGLMVINFIESSKSHMRHHYFMIQTISTALKDMVAEGLIDGEKIDDFEFPFYPPTKEEIQRFVKNEGSFHIQQHQHFTLDWDLPTKHPLGLGHDNDIVQNSNDNTMEMDLYVRAKYESGPVRTGAEYMLATHFGEELMDDLFSRVIDLLAHGLKCGKLETYHQVICLVKN